MEYIMTEYIIYCATALTIFVSLFYIYAKYKLSYWRKRGVKTPPTHFIFGNFKDVIMLKKRPAEELCNIYNNADPNDPYIGFYIFHKPMLLLRDPDLIKQIMITDFDIFPNRRFGSRDQKDIANLESLLAMQQPKWKYVRSKLSSTFTNHKIKNIVPNFVECGKLMLDYIDNLPAEAGVKPGDVSSRYIFDILTSYVFGVTTNSFDEKTNVLWKICTGLFSGVRSILTFLIFFYIPQWCHLIRPLNKQIVEHIKLVLWNSINTREKIGNKRGDFIDILLTLKNGQQNPIYKFEKNNLLAHPISLMIAGFEATADALAFCLYELARHPEHQVTLYDEIQTHVSNKELTLDLINKMPFLDSLVTEILRLYPPLPMTDRIATRDYEIESTGLTIEKDVAVYMSANSINHDPKYFYSPQEFIPTREYENSKFHKSLPFGIGPRSCIGQQMAIIMTKIGVIMIISRYILSYEQSNENIKSLHTFTNVSDTFRLLFRIRDTQP